jgi:uncharacterized damage-inducible protein DinB
MISVSAAGEGGGMEFRSRGVLGLVELHEQELRHFLDVWRRFVEMNAPMPEARGDTSYEDRERLAGHILMAARSYLTWIGECVGRPVTDVDASKDARAVAARAGEFMEGVLAAWQKNLANLTDEECAPQTYKSRWGEPYNIEQMLEHAVVHPMRHRIQLEKILERIR